MSSPLGPESNPRLRRVDKQSLLAQCSLFGGLSLWEQKAISQLMRLIEYKKDEVIYREGGEGDAFYVVVSGRFEASVSTGDKKRVLAYLRRGDYFGEMSLLTGQPHSASLRALSDGLTLVLGRDDFKKTIESNSTISLELSRRLSARLKGGEAHSRPLLKSDVISVCSQRRRAGRAAFAPNLAASLLHETHQRTVLIDLAPQGQDASGWLGITSRIPLAELARMEGAGPDELMQKLTKHSLGFEVLSISDYEAASSPQETILWILNYLAIEYRFILIDLPAGFDSLTTKVLSQSDAVFLVTDSHINNVTETRDMAVGLQKDFSFGEDKVAVVIHEVFYGIRTTTTVKRELFGSRICYSLPESPLFEEKVPARGVPVVLDEPDSDYSRTVRHIARRLSNNLVGLVLGSGAALGMAHVGVLKVLERERIPVDMISGSSMGSLIASLYAVGKSAAEIEEASRDIRGLFRFLRLLDFSALPVRGLFHGQLIMKQFRKHLGNKTFDDCRIPLRIIGTNLSRRETTVFDSGFITDAVRTSIAIPAIFKPTILKGDVLIDGGILSPLPVRVLQEAGANKIIAVNVFPTSKDALERRLLQEEVAEKEDRLMRQRNVLARGLNRIGKFARRSVSPNIFDILMNTIQTMESEISEMEGEAADLLLRPVVPSASWVDFYKPDQFIRRGEEETERMLPKIKALVSQQNA